ncbi:hypothetical protein [Streptomyces nanshensis]|uniref:Uncharacterized protein n=1 Tax=Streptomyces nanshensis TaxID=518642 RepID=A0A1E7L5P4_9ACTN|nr:hypothetical protein [Streptomyces nanshensis]OEV11333.1 hypothetical protein AN218_13350 [Streptomyces nanshensis]
MRNFLIAMGASGAVGLSAMAAVVLPGEPSTARVLAGCATLIFAMPGASYLTLRLLGHSTPSGLFTDSGPDCDRCGNPTRRPYLRRSPQSHWWCARCEQETTDILLDIAARGLA